MQNGYDRSKSGSGHLGLTDANGVPLSDTLTGANRHDVTQLSPLVHAIPTVAGKPGHPNCLPDEIYADQACDSEAYCAELRHGKIMPHQTRRNQEHGSGRGVFRWVSERTLGWLHNFRRLRTRFDRTEEIHHAFLKIAESIICFRTLQSGLC